jgi:hypothetical protein
MLEDNDNKRLRKGIYEIYNGYAIEKKGNKNPVVYYVFQDSGEWKAESPSGQAYVLDIPQGMPDSSRMPKGKMNVSNLTRVSKQEALRYVKNMKAHAIEVKQKINFLERTAGL